MYYLGNQIKDNETGCGGRGWGSMCYVSGKAQVHTEFWWGKLMGKSPLGRPKRSWDDNINTDLKEICWEDVDWTDIFQDRDKWRELINGIMNTVFGLCKIWVNSTS